MENLLIIREIGDLMLLEIINEQWIQMSEQVSVFISSMKHGMPQLEQYEDKKNILFELKMQQAKSRTQLKVAGIKTTNSKF